MTQDQIILFSLFGAVFALLLWGRYRYDIVAFSALIAGVLLGVVDTKEAFNGFGHPATIIVALVLVVLPVMVILEPGSVFMSKHLQDGLNYKPAHVGILLGVCAGAGTSAAFATASISTPSRAPCRSSPTKSRLRNVCSVAVARSSRAPSTRFLARAPRASPMAVIAASTSVSVNVACGATGTSTPNTVAGPTPIRPCRMRPASAATPTSASSGSRFTRHAARAAIFSRRERVAATRSEHSTNSAKRIDASGLLNHGSGEGEAHPACGMLLSCDRFGGSWR